MKSHQCVTLVKYPGCLKTVHTTAHYTATHQYTLGSRSRLEAKLKIEEVRAAGKILLPVATDT